MPGELCQTASVKQLYDLENPFSLPSSLLILMKRQMSTILFYTKLLFDLHNIYHYLYRP